MNPSSLIVPAAKPSVGNREPFIPSEPLGLTRKKGNRRLGRICRHCWPNDCGCFL